MGGRSIFRRGQGARLRPATPSRSACPAEESQEETSVASTPGTADVMADEFKEEEMDPGVPWNHGAKAPPMALQPRWYGPPPGPPQGPSPQGLQQGPLGPQHGPQGLQQGLQHGHQGEGLQDAGGAPPKAVTQAVQAPADNEPQGGDLAEPAGEG